MSDKFWTRLAAPDARGCRLWTGHKHRRNGYGYTTEPRMRRGGVGTHRIAWFLTHGPIPPGLCVCHRCDVPLCCNPDHLFLGTKAENNADRSAKGRNAIPPRAEANWRSKLTTADREEIRRRYAAGGVSTPKLALEYGVSRRLIRLVLESGKAAKESGT